MVKRIILGCLLLMVPTSGFPSDWATINGIYIGMPATKAKNMGFTACTPPDPQLKQPHFHAFDVEECKYVGNKMEAFLGEKVTRFEVGIFSGKVESIEIEIVNEHGKAIYDRMTKRYGKPKRIGKSGVDWEKGSENIGLIYLDNGNYEIIAITYANIPNIGESPAKKR